jgi:hypothetical protein
MKRHCTTVVLAGLLLALVLPAIAQAQAPTPAPNIIQIYREELKPGHGPAHAKTEAGWPRAFAKANWPTHYIAITSMTGPNEAWFIAPFDSLSAWEKDINETAKNAALQAELDRLSEEDGQHLAGYRGIVARYRADLSHRPGVSIPTMRYFSITIVRIRPGHNPDFEGARKIIKEAHEKAGVKDNHSVYQVMSGMPNGTFFIITPMKSLAEVDAGPQVHGQAYQDAIGEAGRQKMRELAASGTISSDTNYYAITPGISYPSKEYIDADPAFWKPKAPAKASPPAKKEAKP